MVGNMKDKLYFKYFKILSILHTVYLAKLKLNLMLNIEEGADQNNTQTFAKKWWMNFQVINWIESISWSWLSCSNSMQCSFDWKIPNTVIKAFYLHNWVADHTGLVRFQDSNPSWIKEKSLKPKAIVSTYKVISKGWRGLGRLKYVNFVLLLLHC